MKLQVLLPVIFVLLAGAVLIGFLGSRNQACRDFTEGQLLAGQTTLNLAFARTTEDQQRGLAGCNGLPENSGMYFEYANPTEARFWMKGMVIPIDIIWIANGQVIGIESHVPPPQDHKTELLSTYSPPRAVTAVLEVAAGAAAEYGIREGTPILLK